MYVSHYVQVYEYGARTQSYDRELQLQRCKFLQRHG
jgi:hypothetical protein